MQRSFFLKTVCTANCMDEKEKKNDTKEILALSSKIIELARDEIMMSFRFLDRSLMELKSEARPGCANVYSGIAFGIGIERITMLKYGINNIGLLFENDLRFLKQF